MPISKPFKLIFVHIPKVAGTSIEKYLGMASVDQLFSFKKTRTIPSLKNKFPENSLALFKTPQHMTALELKGFLSGEVFNSYTKFAVSRNPYKKIVSEYCHVKDTFGEENKEYKNMSLDEFIKNTLVLEEKERVRIFDGHLETQCSYIFDENKNLLVDKLFKLENFQECIDFLKSIVGIDGFPHARQPISSEGLELSDESKEIVKQFYKEDFDFFGY